MKSTIETVSGRTIDYRLPSAREITLNDIVVGLSNACRFGGQVTEHYTVLEHALLVRELVIEMGFLEFGLAALHHDSHEAYTGDLPKPLKNVLGDSIKQVNHLLDGAIAAWLKIDPRAFKTSIIKEADRRALYLETTLLKASAGEGWDWPWAPGRMPTWPAGWRPFTATPATFYLAHAQDTRRMVQS